MYGEKSVKISIVKMTISKTTSTNCGEFRDIRPDFISLLT